MTPTTKQVHEPGTPNETSTTNTVMETTPEPETYEEAKAAREHDHGHEDEEVIVDWDGPADPANPKNWSYPRKWAATIVVSSFTFISPISSSMIAPASANVADEFGITSGVIEALVTSVFILAFAFGPLFLGPLSEIYGRSRVLQLANLFFLAWNLSCGFAKTTTQLLIFRFFAGLGGSAPLSVGGGVLGDTWAPEERGKAIAIYSLAPLLGPVVGPVAGAWIAEKSTWRWVFWSTSIFDVVIQISGLFFLQETYAPYLLEQKSKRIQKELDQHNRVVDAEKADVGAHKRTKRARTVFEGPDRHWQHIFAKALFRPFQLFYSESIVQLLGVYMAFVYGTLYLFLTSMTSIFQGVYKEPLGIAGLNYIALGVGLTIASQINARFMDKVYVYLKETRGNGVGRPEFRLPSMIPGTIVLPIGLLITGWAVEYKVHWIVPDIGIALVGAGIILNFQTIQVYTVDAFTLHAASALAAISFLRALAGFGFPLFAPIMYERLGFGKSNTILAVCSIVVGCPAPWLFWRYGEKIRMKSRYAAGKK